jgi:hypothetical protein
MGAGSDPSPQLGHPDMHNPATAVENRYQAETVVVKNNLIYNTSNYDALSAKGWMNYHIYNNTIFNHRGSTAMYISGAYWEFFDTTALAYCQTHACSPCTNYRGTKACVQILLPSKNGNVFNNIVHTFANRAITVERGNTTGLTSANNVYFTSGINADTAGRFAVNGTSYSLRKFQSLGYETRSNVVNPQLRNVSNVSNPDLRLNPGSPVIDKGMLIASVIADFAGTRRPQGAVHEPGAYEFAGSGISGLDEKVFLPLVLD